MQQKKQFKLNKWTEIINAHIIHVIYKHLIVSPLTVSLFVNSRTTWNKAVFIKCKTNTKIRKCSIQLKKKIYRISTLLKIIVNNFNSILVQFTCKLLIILAHWHVHSSNCTTSIWNTMRRGHGGAGGVFGHIYSYLHEPPHNKRWNMRTYRFSLVNWMCSNLK